MATTSSEPTNIKFSATNNVAPQAKTVERAKTTKEILADAVNAVGSHVALGPVVDKELSESEYIRWLKVPGTRADVTVVELPEQFKSYPALTTEGATYGYSYNASKINSVAYHQETFLAVLRPASSRSEVIGFGNDPQEAIENAAINAHAKGTIKRLPTSKEWSETLDSAKQELEQRPRKRVFIKTSACDDKLTNLTHLLRPASNQVLALKVQDDCDFDATNDPEPYSFQGTYRHNYSILEVQNKLTDENPYGDIDPSVYEEGPMAQECPRFYDGTPEKIFVVARFDEGSSGDYYESHTDVLTAEAAFAVKAEAEAFAKLLRDKQYQHNKGLGWRGQQSADWRVLGIKTSRCVAPR